MVVDVLNTEMVLPFVPPRRVVSDNATAFSAAVVKEYMKSHGIEWKPVLAYFPMADGRAVRMVATIKLALNRTVVRADLDIAEVLPRVLSEYRRSSRGKGASAIPPTL